MKFNLFEKVIVFLIIGIIFILIFSINKGFDLKDEGLHLALSNPYQENNFAQLNQNIFFNTINKILNVYPSIIGLRIIKIVLLIISYLLIWSVLRFFKVRRFFIFFYLIGIFGHYAYFSQSLSYNTLTYFFWICIIFLIFNYVYCHKSLFFIFFIGFISGLIFLVKSTVGILLIPLILFLLLLEWFDYKKNGILIVSISLFCFGFLCVQFSFSSEINFLQVIENGFELSDFNSTHNTLSIIKYPLSAFRWVFVLFFSGFFLKRGIASYRAKQKNLSFVMFFVLFLYFILSHNKLDFSKSWEYLPLAVSYVLIGFLFSGMEINNLKRKDFIFFFIVFVSPLIISFGSNVYHFSSGIIHISFSFFLISIFYNNQKIKLPNYFNFIILGLSAIIFLRVAFNTIFSPFNQPSLLNELQSYSYYDGKSIMIPKSYHRYLTDLKKVLNKNVPESRSLLGLYEMPGDILLAGRYNYINPCVWEHYQYDFYIGLENKKNSIDSLYILTRHFNAIEDLDLYPIEMLDSLMDYNNEKLYLIKGRVKLDSN